MANPFKVRIIITLNKPDLDDQELERETQDFYEEMLQVKGLEQVKRVRDTTPLEGEKGGSFLPGLLKAEVESANLKDASRDVHELSSRKADIAIVNGTERITVEANNRSSEDFSLEVEKAAQQVLTS